MIRWTVLVAGVGVASAAAFVAGASVPEKAAAPPAEAKAEPGAKPPVVVGQKAGYFNMAKVMRDYKRARTAVARLNARKDRLSADLVGLRNMHGELQRAGQKAADPKRKDEIAEDLIHLARQIEDGDRALQKMLNDKATFIIAELYDEIYATAESVARENGLVALLAYPDAVTAEDRQNPMLKEMKLKPPAAYPFYLDPSVEYSDEMLRRLNEKFNADDDN